MQDEDVFEVMVSQLRATAKFQMVQWGIYTGSWPQQGSYVNILRTQVTNDDRHASNTDEERQVGYRVFIRYTTADDNIRNRKLMNYEALITNFFHNKSIGGITIPGKTRIYRGRPGKPTSTNEGAWDLDGYFTYRVQPKDALEVKGI